MKKSLLILLTLIPLIALSCHKDKKPSEEKPDPAAMIVATTSFSAQKGEGTVTVPVEANYSTIKVSISDDAKDWLYFVSASATKAEMASYSVVLGVRENPTVKPRTGQATIKLDNLSQVVSVTQEAGDPTISTDVETVKVNPRGMTVAVPVLSNDEVHVSTSASWLSAGNTTAEGIELVAAANTSGEARTADVTVATVTDANVKVSFTVVQKAFNVDPNAISILAVGNNASAAVMTNLYSALDSVGYTSIRLGNLYNGDTKLADQAALIKSEELAYKYTFVGADGKWVTTDTTAIDLLEPEDWDFIVLQEATEEAGNGYAALGEVISAIRESNPFTPLAWSVAWAPGGVADQAEKFESIIDQVRNAVVGNDEIAKIIPTGTAIQNLRTSFFEDNIGSGNNLSENIGQQTAALTWLAALTGKTVTEDIFPECAGYEYELPYKPAVVEAVTNAIANPLSVTKSAEYAPFKSAADETAAKAAIKEAGFNPDEYTQVPITLIFRGFWNSTSSTALSVAWAKTTGATKNSFVSSVKLAKSALPVGTLIYVAPGFQYRPEGWQSLTANNNKTRPNNTSETIVEVTPTWWDASGFNYRAFNVSKTSGTIEYGEMETVVKSFGVFVPKTAITGGLEDYGNGEWNW